MLSNFNKHSEISDFFLDYIKDKELDYIDWYANLNDLKKDVAKLVELEYKGIISLIDQKCKNRWAEIDKLSATSTLKVIMSAPKELRSDHLKSLPQYLAGSDREKLIDFYRQNNNLKRRINELFKNRQYPHDIDFIWWLDFIQQAFNDMDSCLLYTSPSPRDQRGSRMPSSA